MTSEKLPDAQSAPQSPSPGVTAVRSLLTQMLQILHDEWNACLLEVEAVAKRAEKHIGPGSSAPVWSDEQFAHGWRLNNVELEWESEHPLITVTKVPTQLYGMSDKYLRPRIKKEVVKEARLIRMEQALERKEMQELAREQKEKEKAQKKKDLKLRKIQERELGKKSGAEQKKKNGRQRPRRRTTS